MAKNKNFYIKWVAIFLSIGAFGAAFDGYWHLANGIENFFVLPHLFIYTGTIGGIILSWQAYQSTAIRAWKHLALTGSLIILGGLVDMIWHGYRGLESAREVSIAFSPPHVLILLAATIGLVLFANLLRNEPGFKQRNVLGPMMFGLALTVLMIILGPFLPMGPHQIYGTMGIIIISCAVVLTFLSSSKLFPNSFAATLTALVLCTLLNVIYDQTYIPNDSFLHMPAWLALLHILIPALLIDFINSRNHTVTVGALAGLLHGLVFFGFGGLYIAHNSLTYLDLAAGSFVAALGGLLAGVVISFIEIKHVSEN